MCYAHVAYVRSGRKQHQVELAHIALRALLAKRHVKLAYLTLAVKCSRDLTTVWWEDYIDICGCEAEAALQACSGEAFSLSFPWCPAYYSNL